MNQHRIYDIKILFVKSVVVWAVYIGCDAVYIGCDVVHVKQMAHVRKMQLLCVK